jgi:hypothetical protein
MLSLATPTVDYKNVSKIQSSLNETIDYCLLDLRL